MTTVLLLSILSLPIGFALLVFSSDKFVEGAAALANNLGVSHAIIGITIVGFATSSPEILISIFAALDGNSGIAVGNVIGSNIANTALILGTGAALYAIVIKRSLLLKETPILFVIMGVVLYMMLDRNISQIEGFILIIALIALMAWLTYSELKKPSINDEDDDIPDDIPNKTAILWLIFGLLMMIGSSKLLIWGAVNIAQFMGISDLVIGLTIIALGTSLPELAATVSSVKKGQHDLAVGNVIGSNLFNLLAVLGIAAVITPIPIEHDALYRDMPVLFASMGLFLLLCWLKPNTTPNGYTITQWGGRVLVLFYLVYQSYIIYSALA